MMGIWGPMGEGCWLTTAIIGSIGWGTRRGNCMRRFCIWISRIMMMCLIGVILPRFWELNISKLLTLLFRSQRICISTLIGIRKLLAFLVKMDRFRAWRLLFIRKISGPMGRNLYTWSLLKEGITSKVHCRYLERRYLKMETGTLDSSIKECSMVMEYWYRLKSWNGFSVNFFKVSSVRLRNLITSNILRSSFRLGLRIWEFYIGGSGKGGLMLTFIFLNKFIFTRSCRTGLEWRWRISTRIKRMWSGMRLQGCQRSRSNFKEKNQGILSIQKCRGN